MTESTDPLYRSYFDLRWHFDPAAATEAGVTAQNHRLGDFDPDSMHAHLAAFKSLALAMEALDPEGLDAEIDRTAVLNEVRSTIYQFEHDQPHVRSPVFWLTHLYNALYALLDRTDPAPGERAIALVARLRAVPPFLDAAVSTLKDPAPILLEAAAQMVDAGGVLIGQAARFAREQGAGPGEEVDQAAAEAEAALARFGLALKTELAAAGDVHGFAIGEDSFNRRLHLEYALQSSAPELWRYGLHLVEETEDHLAAMAREMDGGSSWKDLVERWRQDAPMPENAIEAYRTAMQGARDFVARRDLVAIPDAPLEILPTPDFLEPLIPFAAYSPPGPYSADRTGRFYVTARADGRRSTRSRFELPSQALHEGYPGHHLHMVTSQALGSEIRRVLWSPLTVEGWALYCEDMMVAEGFVTDPVSRLFQQVHLLWRAVRILLDIGLHTRNMSPDAAVLFLMDKVPMSEAEARAEVRRYCSMPTYQLCYAVGRREIADLREDYRAKLGSGFTLRRFHDALLEYGGLPVSLARWGLLR